MSYDNNQYVEIPADKLREAVSAAYDLSSPRGMGMLHARPGPLDDATIDQLLADGIRGAPSLDYVHGRCCKFRVREDAGKFYVSPHWYDHTRSDLIELLARLGIEDGEQRIDAAIAAQEKAAA